MWDMVSMRRRRQRMLITKAGPRAAHRGACSGRFPPGHVMITHLSIRDTHSAQCAVYGHGDSTRSSIHRTASAHRIWQYRAHSTQHTARRTPHTAHRTPHTAHSTPHRARITQHTAHRTKHTAHSTGHTSQSTHHTAHSTPHRAHRTEHRARITQHRAHRTEHTAQSTHHTAYSTHHTSRIVQPQHAPGRPAAPRH